MSLFSKTEISKEILPFIENGEGVGIVKVNGYGKASARMESYKIIFDSYEGKSPIIESVSAITYLSYKKGNFLNEPKLEIGISHKKYILAGVDNNDAELETFYKTILDVKNLEKEQKRSSYVGINKSAIENETKNVEPVSNELTEDDLDLEQEILKEDITQEEVDSKVEEEVQDDTEDLEKIIEEDDDDFEVLEELDEDIEVTDEPQEEEKEVAVAESEEVEDEIKSSDEIIMDDVEEDDEDEFEEIILESDEPPVEEENLLSDEPIIEDFDEDFEDEIADNGMDSGRIIKESDEIEDEVLVEEDISEEIEEEVKPAEEDAEEEVVSNAKENIIEDKNQLSTPQIDDTEITQDNVKSEIGKMKQKLFDGINNIQNPADKNNQNGSANTQAQLDPVDQIRRYYELKEDGIITEEEFELKKKQLLDL